MDNGKIPLKFSGLVYHRAMRIFIAGLCVLPFIILLGILNWHLEMMFRRSNDITILTMIDVGQGDGFSIDYPNGQKVFIDIGDRFEKIQDAEDNSQNNSIFRKIFYRKTADLVFLTHDDADHAGALTEFSKYFKIGALGLSQFRYTYVDKFLTKKPKNTSEARYEEIFISGGYDKGSKKITNATQSRLENQLKFVKNSMTLQIPEFLIRGIIFDFSENNEASSGSQISILYPDIGLASKYFTGSNSRSDNASSLIMKFFHGSTTIIFTGDAGIDEEKKLLGAQYVAKYRAQNRAQNFAHNPELTNQSHQNLESDLWTLNSDILKVGHHGSKGSTDPEFIKAISPSLAFISVGKKNKYGHPHPDVLKKLADFAGMDYGRSTGPEPLRTEQIIRTDICGTVIFHIYKNGALGRRDCGIKSARLIRSERSATAKSY